MTEPLNFAQMRAIPNAAFASGLPPVLEVYK